MDLIISRWQGVGGKQNAKNIAKTSFEDTKLNILTKIDPKMVLKI